MVMKVEHPETGEEIDVYTQEDLDAIQAEKQALLDEAEKLRKVNIEKTENLKKLRDMSEEDKGRYTAEQIELIRRTEEQAEQLEALRSESVDKEQREFERNKEAALKQYHNGNEDMKAKIEANWDLVNLPGTTLDVVAARAEHAARLAQIEMVRSNPLNGHMSGHGPSSSSPTESDVKMNAASGLLAKELGINLE